MISLHAWVSGRVQGVGFRYFVRQQAAVLPLTGWVRNLHDGRVEVLAEGSRPDLENLLAALKRGPAGSEVTDVIVEWGEANGELQNFSVQPTSG
jgi:acylphosphatase